LLFRASPEMDWRTHIGAIEADFHRPFRPTLWCGGKKYNQLFFAILRLNHYRYAIPLA